MKAAKGKREVRRSERTGDGRIIKTNGSAQGQLAGRGGGARRGVGQRKG